MQVFNHILPACLHFASNQTRVLAKMIKTRKSTCPISYCLDVVGDKWTLLILRDILLFQKSQYRDFLNSEEKIATNILADRLHKMVESGLLAKKEDPENRTQNMYIPTARALELLPLVTMMAKWGLKHGKGTRVSPELARLRKASL